MVNKVEPRLPHTYRPSWWCLCWYSWHILIWVKIDWWCFAAIHANETNLLQLLLTQNAEMKEQVMFNTKLLQELVKRQRGMESFTAGQLPKNVRVPLTSRDDVTRIEQQLQSQETYKQLVSSVFAVFLMRHICVSLCYVQLSSRTAGCDIIIKWKSQLLMPFYSSCTY